jgi:hypothetical protein
LAAGPVAAGSVVSTKVAALTEGVLNAMMINKLKIVMGVVVALLVGTTLAYGAMRGGQPRGGGDDKDHSGPPPTTVAPAEKPTEERADPKQAAPPAPVARPPHIVEKIDMKGRMVSGLPFPAEEPTEDGLAVVTKSFFAKMRTYPDIRFREFFDPRYLKKHGLTDRDIAFEFSDSQSICNIDVADDRQTVLVVLEQKGGVKEAFVMRWIVYEGHLYVSPEKAPDAKTGIFAPWILRTKVH